MFKTVFRYLFPLVCMVVLLGIGFCYIGDAEHEATFSEEENRMLAAAPNVAKSIGNGSLDSDTENYLLDHFPYRQQMIAKASKLKDTLSISSYEDFVRANPTSEDPLDSGANQEDLDELLAQVLSSTPRVTATPRPTPTQAPVIVVPGEPTPEPTPEMTPTPAEYPPIEPKPEPNIQDYKSPLFTKMVLGGKTTNMIGYSKNSVIALTAVLNKYAALLPEGGKLMFTIVPQSPYANQYIRSSKDGDMMMESIEVVNAFGADNVYAFDAPLVLTPHMQAGEYVFFRTDMHWTPLGAYYLYREMVARAGYAPGDYESDYAHDTEKGFLGTLYRDNPSASLKSNADTLELISPSCPHELRRVDGPDHYRVIPYLNYKANAGDRYTIYLGGPGGPWTYVECDNDMEENALVIMDSFGLVFFSFLTNNYKQVHYYDPRYFNKKTVGGSVADMIERYQIKDIYVVLGDLHSFNAGFLTTDANRQLE